MHTLYYILVLTGTFIIMEGITWCTHRYVMHGFLWILHKDHHQVRPGIFEKNDLFAFIFAVPSFLLIYFGTYDHVWWMQATGFGIMAYGFAYFMVHDVIIHQRFKWFSRSNHTYVRAIRWAHKMHHKHLGKEHGESFGFLVVNKKYWQKVLRDKKLMAGNARVEYAPEEPGVGSSESGVQSREPGVRSSESGAQSREPGVGSSESGVQSREPGVGSPV